MQIFQGATVSEGSTQMLIAYAQIGGLQTNAHARCEGSKQMPMPDVRAPNKCPSPGTKNLAPLRAFNSLSYIFLMWSTRSCSVMFNCQLLQLNSISDWMCRGQYCRWCHGGEGDIADTRGRRTDVDVWTHGASFVDFPYVTWKRLILTNEEGLRRAALFGGRLITIILSMIMVCLAANR